MAKATRKIESMPTATTKSYPVEYIHIDSPTKIPELIALMLSINYNIDMNTYREIIPGTPEIISR